MHGPDRNNLATLIHIYFHRRDLAQESQTNKKNRRIHVESQSTGEASFHLQVQLQVGQDQMSLNLAQFLCLQQISSVGQRPVLGHSQDLGPFGSLTAFSFSLVPTRLEHWPVAFSTLLCTHTHTEYGQKNTGGLFLSSLSRCVRCTKTRGACSLDAESAMLPQTEEITSLQ